MHCINLQERNKKRMRKKYCTPSRSWKSVCSLSVLPRAVFIRRSGGSMTGQLERYFLLVAREREGGAETVTWDV